MTNVVVVLDENGCLIGAYSDSEIDFSVLRKGKDDNQIASTEVNLKPLEV